jgi:hypothetical protein
VINETQSQDLAECTSGYPTSQVRDLGGLTTGEKANRLQGIASTAVIQPL